MQPVDGVATRNHVTVTPQSRPNMDNNSAKVHAPLPLLVCYYNVKLRSGFVSVNGRTSLTRVDNRDLFFFSPLMTKGMQVPMISLWSNMKLASSTDLNSPGGVPLRWEQVRRQTLLTADTQWLRTDTSRQICQFVGEVQQVWTHTHSGQTRAGRWWCHSFIPDQNYNLSHIVIVLNKNKPWPKHQQPTHLYVRASVFDFNIQIYVYKYIDILINANKMCVFYAGAKYLGLQLGNRL